MARIYWTGLVAAAVLAGCGDSTAPAPIPSVPWFTTGAPINLTVFIDDAYDCAPESYPGAPDPAICAGATDTVRISVDTLRLSGVLDSVREGIIGFASYLPVSGTLTTCPLRPVTACAVQEITDTATVSVTPTFHPDSLYLTTNLAIEVAGTGAVQRSITLLLIGTPDPTGVEGGGLPALGDDGPSWLHTRRIGGIHWRMCSGC